MDDTLIAVLLDFQSTRHIILPFTTYLPKYICSHRTASLALVSVSATIDASQAVEAGRDLVTLAALDSLITSIVNLAHARDLGTARVLDGRSIAVILVDTGEDTAARGSNVLEDHFARTSIALAVTAGAVDLAKVLDQEVLDMDSALSVVLDNLVRGE